MRQATNSNTIAAHLAVRNHPTVVRLDDLPLGDNKACQSHWINTSFITTDQVKNHFDALDRLLQSQNGCGIFLIGQYGSGKSHFLAKLASQLSCADLTHPAPAHPGPTVKTISLVNYSAENRLEEIILSCFKRKPQTGDRRITWQQLLEQNKISGDMGLVLIIDELSEFLRSKNDVNTFNEDIRFLQFLGEWAQDHPLWIIAAMQEGIEHTGELEYSLYRKIKDRFPQRWLLPPAHVKTLVADSLLIKGEHYDAGVAKLIQHWQAAMPDADIDYAQMAQIYPLHPETIKLMEEIRDRFSQTRGVIDFVAGQLCGDVAKQRAPFLQKAWGEVLTPDLIIDHFHDLLEVQSEFQPLAQQVFPWFEQHLAQLFDRPALITLARRLLNLLVLVYLSPARETLNVEQAVSWLLFSASILEPSKNKQIIRRVLDTLSTKGRYINCKGDAYRLNLNDDSAAVFERHLQRELSEFPGNKETILETLSENLHAPSFDVFSLPLNRWQSRQVSWHFHSRHYSVWLGNQPPTQMTTGSQTQASTLCIKLPWGDPHPTPGMTNLIPAALDLSPDIRELAALIRLSQQPLPIELIRRCQHRIETLRSAWFKHLNAAWRDAHLISSEGSKEALPMVHSKRGLDGFLDQVMIWALRKQFPGFEQFAPGFGPLSKGLWPRYLALDHGHSAAEIDQDNSLKLIFEAYLLPLKLLRRQASGYVVRTNLERHELINIIRNLAAHTVSPDTLYQHLAGPIYGLVTDQITALLLFLLRLGEIDILKGSHSLGEYYSTLPNPLHYDRIVLGQALPQVSREELQQLCLFANIALPKDASMFSLRKAIDSLKEYASKRISVLEKLALETDHPIITASYQAADGIAEPLIIDDIDSLGAKIHTQTGYWRLLLEPVSPLHAFEIFLQTIHGINAFIKCETLLQQVAEELPKLLTRLRQCQHLMFHQDIQTPIAITLRQQLEALGTPPTIENFDALSQWCDNFEQHYQSYQQHYKIKHDEWWLQYRADARTDWRPPEIAHSQHLELGSTLKALQQCRQAINQTTCEAISELHFQPLCRCGFNGKHALIEQHSDHFAALKTELKTTLKAFFAQASVHQRLQQWRQQGLKLTPGLLAYLDGQQDLPVIDDLGLLDKHLAGLPLIKEVASATIMDLLQSRHWTPADLKQALNKFITQLGGEHLRFINGEDSKAVSGQIATWCAEQALKTGTPLPTLGQSAHKIITATLQPDWISPAALNQLHTLGFQDNVIQKILNWMINGQLSRPSELNQASPVSAASALVEDNQIYITLKPNPDQLAQYASMLYLHHDTLMRLNKTLWLAELGRLSDVSLPPIPDLSCELKQQHDAQWLLLDCFASVLVAPLKQSIIKLLCDWSPPTYGWAQAKMKTTTDNYYRSLLEADVKHGFHKINVIDKLIHQRRYPLEELIQRTTVELSLSIKQFRKELDPAKPLCLFADHGFRISSDGKRYQHGGDSWLERMVPIWRFENK